MLLGAQARKAYMVKKAAGGQQSAVKINTPFKNKDISNLRAGDLVSVSGRIVTGTDRVHKFLFEEKPAIEDIPFNLSGSLLYHCSPVIKKGGDGYKAVACGPLMSSRLEMYTPWVIRKYGIKAIAGKGGMGRDTLDALKESGGIYLQTPSAAAFLADKIKTVADSWKIEEFGISEAMWLLEIEDFPAIVTIDAHGSSLHKDIENISSENLRKLLYGENETELMRS